MKNLLNAFDNYIECEFVMGKNEIIVKQDGYTHDHIKLEGEIADEVQSLKGFVGYAVRTYPEDFKGVQGTYDLSDALEEVIDNDEYLYFKFKEYRNEEGEYPEEFLHFLVSMIKGV